MKKIYSLRKSVLPFLFLAVMAVACGLRIMDVEFSTHEPEQGSTITVTSSLLSTNYDDMNDMGSDHNQQADYYLFYAIRVPNDWSAEGLVTSIVLEDERTNQAVLDEYAAEMIECANYAQLCDYCFPLEGYKWVAYQSKEMVKQGSRDKATVTLKVGDKMGDYKLAIMVGGWKYDPAELIKDGSVNFDVVFGHNNNRTDFNKNDAKDRYKTSEYLFSATTLTNDEVNAYNDVLKASGVTATPLIQDKEIKALPIELDVANVNDRAHGETEYNMNVTVKAGAGVANVAVDAENGEAEYFDLQGRKVANPENGLYLVKRGNTVTKEIVK